MRNLGAEAVILLGQPQILLTPLRVSMQVNHLSADIPTTQIGSATCLQLPAHWSADIAPILAEFVRPFRALAVWSVSLLQ